MKIDIMLFKHLILEIMKHHTEENPILREDLRAQLPKISDRRLRIIIQDEIRPYYPIGSVSNDPSGYYTITTLEGLERYRNEIRSRVHELWMNWKHAKQSFNRIHQPELNDLPFRGFFEAVVGA